MRAAGGAGGGVVYLLRLRYGEPHLHGTLGAVGGGVVPGGGVLLRLPPGGAAEDGQRIRRRAGGTGGRAARSGRWWQTPPPPAFWSACGGGAGRCGGRRTRCSPASAPRRSCCGRAGWSSVPGAETPSGSSGCTAGTPAPEGGTRCARNMTTQWTTSGILPSRWRQRSAAAAGPGAWNGGYFDRQGPEEAKEAFAMKRRERNKGPARAEAVQIRESGRHPFGVLDRYVPLRGGGAPALPGHPGGGAHRGRGHLEADPAGRRRGGRSAGSPAPRRGWSEFLRTVPTGRGQRGIQSFLDCYLDSMLTCGRAVGETRAGLPGPGDRRSAVRRTGAGGDPGGGLAPGLSAVCPAARAEPVSPCPGRSCCCSPPFSPEAEQPLRGVPAAVHALSHRTSC